MRASVLFLVALALWVGAAAASRQASAARVREFDPAPILPAYDLLFYGLPEASPWRALLVEGVDVGLVVTNLTEAEAVVRMMIATRFLHFAEQRWAHVVAYRTGTYEASCAVYTEAVAATVERLHSFGFTPSGLGGAQRAQCETACRALLLASGRTGDYWNPWLAADEYALLKLADRLTKTLPTSGSVAVLRRSLGLP